MNTRNIWLVILAVVIVVLIGVGAVWAFSDKTPGTPTPTTPTPVVENPTPTPTPETESTTAGLNQRILLNGVHITPLAVLADSRCPVDVQCIQAGDVTLSVKLENGTSTETVTMITGSPVSFGNKHVALMSVTPAKNSKTTIKPSDYRFTFTVAYGMGGDAP